MCWICEKVDRPLSCLSPLAKRLHLFGDSPKLPSKHPSKTTCWNLWQKLFSSPEQVRPGNVSPGLKKTHSLSFFTLRVCGSPWKGGLFYPRSSPQGGLEVLLFSPPGLCLPSLFLTFLAFYPMPICLNETAPPYSYTMRTITWFLIALTQWG